MALYHSKNAMVYISSTGTGGGFGKLVGCTEWTLDMSTDTVEVTAFGDVNKTYVQGLPDLSGTVTGFWDNTEDKWFQAANSSDGCYVYLYFSSNEPSTYAYGPAWLSISMSNSVTGASEISGNFIAKGNWTVRYW